MPCFLAHLNAAFHLHLVLQQLTVDLTSSSSTTSAPPPRPHAAAARALSPPVQALPSSSSRSASWNVRSGATSRAYVAGTIGSGASLTIGAAGP